MSNADQPGNPKVGSAPSFDDIPMAEREVVEAPSKPKSGRWLWVVLLGTIALATGTWLAYQWYVSRSAATPAPASSVSPVVSATPSPENLLGHLPYSEAPQTELQSASDDGTVKLRAPAAKAFREMANAAAAEGVFLTPLSGFRSIAEQQDVYFRVKQERAQTPTERAQVSAPPGYSEHHTGYAIDIGDGNVPATNLSPNFEQTRAFKWLEANAARFSFEISFPQGNKQGVTYEPWHWRFVGDRASLETFYKARQEDGKSDRSETQSSPEAAVSPAQ